MVLKKRGERSLGREEASSSFAAPGPRVDPFNGNPLHSCGEGEDESVGRGREDEGDVN